MISRPFTAHLRFMNYDIIGDIYRQYDKLILGYADFKEVWSHNTATNLRRNGLA